MPRAEATTVLYVFGMLCTALYEVPMVVSSAGKVTLGRLLQLANASLPMVVNPLGRVTLVRLLHPQNANSPMVVTPSQISIYLSVPVSP